MAKDLPRAHLLPPWADMAPSRPSKLPIAWEAPFSAYPLLREPAASCGGPFIHLGGGGLGGFPEYPR